MVADPEAEAAFLELNLEFAMKGRTLLDWKTLVVLLLAVLSALVAA